MNHRLFLAASAVILVFAGIQSIQAKDYPDWNGYPPFNAVNDILEFKGMVYGTAKGGIFRYDPSGQKYTLYYKNNGLPSNDVRCVAATSEYLYFGFATSGIMRFDPRTEAFEPLLFPEYIPNDIDVRAICAKNDSILYVGHSLGVDVLNVVTGEVKTYTQLGKLAENTSVNDIKLFRGKIWVCTSLGLAVADEDNPNLDSASSWKTYTWLTPESKLIAFNSVINLVDDLEDTMYFATDLGIFYLDEKDNKLYDTAATGGGPAYRFGKAMGRYFAASTVGLYRKYSRVWQLYDTDYSSLKCLGPGTDRLWVGTGDRGVQCYTDSGYVDIATMPGPKSAKFKRIEFGEGGAVWSSSGGISDEGIVQRFQHDTWKSYVLKLGKTPFQPMAVKSDGQGNIWVPVYADYIGNALYFIPGGGDAANPDSAFTAFDNTSAIIRPTIAKNFFCCTDAVRDSRGNIWVANLQLDQPDTESGGRNHNLEDVPSSGVVVFDGNHATKFRHFSPASGDISTAKINRLCVDNDGWVWAGAMKKGVMAFNYGDDPFNTDRTPIRRHLLLEDNLYSQAISCIEVDKDGYVWVGSDAGLNRITKLSNYELKVDQMNQLLGTASTQIYSIEVDRLNNKWIGTASGLVKISPENELVSVYTTDNSGLFSNFIYDLKYDDASDVLWIGTDAGLNSFHVFGEKSSGDARIVRVYPNPFSIWGSNSSCTFDNLKLNSTVRIFTFNGTRIAELKVGSTSSKGISYASWNGRNYKNEPVASGVYFFTGEDKSGKAFRDKMVVIRR